MDYKIANLQPAHIQQAIYQLALSEFNPVRLVNRIVFLDDANRLLPPDTGNGFYERSVPLLGWKPSALAHCIGTIRTSAD
jgi:hypothetical protein